MNAVLQSRRLAEAAVFVVISFYFIFRIEKYFRVQNCDRGVSMSCILVGNTHAARIKTSCFKFYFEYPLAYQANAIMQKSSCQGFKNRTVQRTVKLLSRFVANEGKKQQCTSQGCSGIPAINK